MDTATEPKLRTQDEIVAEYKRLEEGGDWLGFKRGDLIEFLDFEHAKPLLKEGVTESEWNEAKSEYTREAILKKMEDYMDFAWEKANNMRGISASRSMNHYETWLWLIGEDDFIHEVGFESYQHYGKPQLIKICERFGWNWTDRDDGVRSNG